MIDRLKPPSDPRPLQRQQSPSYRPHAAAVAIAGQWYYAPGLWYSLRAVQDDSGDIEWEESLRGGGVASATLQRQGSAPPLEWEWSGKVGPNAVLRLRRDGDTIESLYEADGIPPRKQRATRDAARRALVINAGPAATTGMMRRREEALRSVVLRSETTTRQMVEAAIAQRELAALGSAAPQRPIPISRFPSPQLVPTRVDRQRSPHQVKKAQFPLNRSRSPSRWPTSPQYPTLGRK